MAGGTMEPTTEEEEAKYKGRRAGGGWEESFRAIGHQERDLSSLIVMSPRRIARPAGAMDCFDFSLPTSFHILIEVKP